MEKGIAKHAPEHPRFATGVPLAMHDPRGKPAAERRVVASPRGDAASLSGDLQANAYSQAQGPRPVASEALPWRRRPARSRANATTAQENATPLATRKQSSACRAPPLTRCKSWARPPRPRWQVPRRPARRREGARAKPPRETGSAPPRCIPNLDGKRPHRCSHKFKLDGRGNAHRGEAQSG